MGLVLGFCAWAVIDLITVRFIHVSTRKKVNMTDEQFARLESIVNELNKEASINIVLEKQFGSMGAYLKPHKDDWCNLEGYNLLGQLRIIMNLLKDVK
jgi:hypothetical protein